MRTTLLMSLSAVALGALGLVLTFLPQETLGYLGSTPAPQAVLLVQAAGALYLGFAFLNWMARANLIGGVYSRPVALGNFLHFAAVTAALLKAIGGGERNTAILVAAAVYLLFAVWFGLVVFTHPAPSK